MSTRNHASAPIAVYDSGIGGLAIAKAIKTLLPQEVIHYIGDSENFPYGEKDPRSLCSYITRVVNFALQQEYKLLVVACHTVATAVAHLMPSYLTTINLGVINVIDPVIDYISMAKAYRRIAVIGTPCTIEYNAYTQSLQAVQITALATPLLAVMVEEKFEGKEIDNTILQHYLYQLPYTAIDALIPACTHYLFLKDWIKSFFSYHCQGKVKFLDVARHTAWAVKQWLTGHDLLNNPALPQPFADYFMATRLTTALKRATQQLFGQGIIAVDLDSYIISTDFNRF